MEMIENNIDNLIYTYKHRKVVMYLAEYYFDDEELIEQIRSHDMDKMLLMLFYNKKDIKKFHNKMASHHDNEREKTKLDYIEMVLDWESARYTKEDKPLNAYDTLIQYYPHLEKEIMPILEELKIAYSTTEKDENVQRYVDTIKTPTLEDIRLELINYINESIEKVKIKEKKKQSIG